MATATNTANTSVSYVQVQTLRGTQGTQAAFATVQAQVAAYNKQNGKATPHTAVLVTALANNTKGMQYQLALLATLARQHGANMVRLSVHNGNVALCGTPAAIAATQAAFTPAHNTYSTMAANAYNAGAHGNRVGFTNGYLCGCPAGLQAGLGIVPTLAYGVGFLFTFAAPSHAAGYALGHNAAKASAKPAKQASTKPAKATTAKAATAAPATAAPATAAPATAAPATAAPATAQNAA